MTVTIAPAVAVAEEVNAADSLPVTVTGADPDTVSVPKDDVALTPVGVTLASPVTTSVPRLGVITLPVGNAVLPIAIVT